MRLLLACTFILSTPVLAAPCLKAAKAYYSEHGQPSDSPLSYRLVSDSDAEELVYQITGSYHSGWFADEMVLRASSCEVRSLRNIYSE